MKLTAALAALPLAALSVSGRQVNSRRHTEHRNRFHRRTTNYTLVEKHQGDTFFDNYNFFSDADPTNGMVNYQTKDNAISKGLAYVQSDGTTVMTVDPNSTLSSGEYRDSVRVSSKNTYSNGLIIADIWAMPHGCSVWPAYWMVGPSWPSDGEIDILEGVNELTYNQYTLHTGTGCTLDQDPTVSTVNETTGKVQAYAANVFNTKCESSASSNSGCGFTDTSTTSYGHGFNMIAGGVFATLIDDTGISIYRFDRGSIPSDIEAGTPDPSSWGVATALWSSSTCDISSHFTDMSIVWDITLCGGWAGDAFSKTCSGTCSDAVKDPENFTVAKWKINYVAIYQ